RHPDRVEAVQYIELGDAESRDAGVDYGAPESHGIEPTAAPAPAGDGAEFVPDPREVLPVAVEELRREGTRADPRRIRFHDPEHVVEDPRSQSRTGAREARRRVGRGDERIGAEVDVEHRSLRTLEEDVGAGL